MGRRHGGKRERMTCNTSRRGGWSKHGQRARHVLADSWLITTTTPLCCHWHMHLLTLMLDIYHPCCSFLAHFLAVLILHQTRSPTVHMRFFQQCVCALHWPSSCHSLTISPLAGQQVIMQQDIVSSRQWLLRPLLLSRWVSTHSLFFCFFRLFKLFEPFHLFQLFEPFKRLKPFKLLKLFKPFS